MSILTEMMVLSLLSELRGASNPNSFEVRKFNVAPVRQSVMPRKRFVVDESEVETGEPDGISVRVDRPRMANYTNFGKFTEDLAKYKSLERAAKDCDWMNRDETCECECQDDDFDDDVCGCENVEEPLMLEVSGEGPGRAVKSNKRLTFEELQRHMQNFDNALRGNWW